MRFLIVSFNYLPESVSIGPYTADLAEYLQQCGHHVQVMAGFPIAPQWRVWKEYRGNWYLNETINGVSVLRTWAYIPAHPKRTINRILFDTSFTLTSMLCGLFVGKADLVVVISPPLQLGITGWLLGLFKDAKFFFHIQDLVPDAAIATGMLAEESRVLSVAHSLENFIYQRAKKIGVICDGFAENLVAKGVPVDKIILQPHYIDTESIYPMERNNNFRQQYGINSDDLLVMYSGSVALKQSLNTFLESAAEFHPDDGITFYLIGEGPYLQQLMERANDLQCSHLHFLPLQPRDTLPTQLSAADVLVITQRRTITDVVFPGKLLYYMAVGRPILAAVNAESETGRFVSRYQVGMVVPPEEPKALAEAIWYLKKNPSEAKRFGYNGRRIAEEMFDQELVLASFAENLEMLAQED